MVRKFKTLLTITCLVFTGTAYGLGLGEITLKSALNQPLLAEIELLQEEGMSPGEILPTLASQSDFRRAGILREFFLSNLLFELASGDNGQLVMLVTTKDPVQEPFLNFMLEVNWPTGRLLKEFTLLLDPPLYDQASLTPFSAPVETPVAVVPAPVTTTVVETTSETVSKPVAVRQEAIQDNEYRVQQNDTLWQIALRARKDKSLTPHQIMLAIQQMNPDAFIDNNINKVKEGSLLVIPTTDEIRNWGLAESVNEVGRQNKAVSATAAATTASVSAVAPSGSAGADTTEQNPAGYLEVVSGAENGLGSASSGTLSDQSRKLTSELTTALELNDQLARENAELKSRMDALQEQLTILQNMIALQSETGVALANQAALATTENEADHMAEAGTLDHTAVAIEADHMAEAADTDNAVAGEVDHMAESAAVDHAAEGAVEHMAAEATHSEAAPDDDHAAAPHHDAEPQSFIAYLWADVQTLLLGSLMNLALVGAAILLIIALIVMVVLKRRSAKGDQIPAIDAEGADDFDFDIDGLGLDDEHVGDPSDVATDADVDALAGIQPATDGDAGHADIVAEADIYIAYGRYDQAEDLLKAALAEDGAREDVKLKLAEVYVETGNLGEFTKLEAELKGGSSSIQQAIADLRSQLPGSAPANGTDGLSPDDFNIDGLAEDIDTLGDGADTGMADDTIKSDATAIDEDFDLDDGLSFENWDSEKTGFDLDSDLSLDEAMDDSMPSEKPEGTADGEKDEDDGSIKFDLSTDFTSTVSEAPAEKPLSEDSEAESDLSLDFTMSDTTEDPIGDSADDGDDVMNFAFDDDMILPSEKADGSDSEIDDEFLMELSPELGSAETDSEKVSADDNSDSLELSLEDDLNSLSAGSVDVDPVEMPADELNDALELSLDDDLDSFDDDLESLMNLDEANKTLDSTAPEESDDGSIDFEAALEGLDDFDNELAAVEDDNLASLKDVPVQDASDDTSDDLPMFTDDNFDLGDLEDLNADLDGMSADDDFEVSDGSDEISTKLDLARAYIDMDEKDGAKEILQEVISEGSAEQIRKAEEMLEQLK